MYSMILPCMWIVGDRSKQASAFPPLNICQQRINAMGCSFPFGAGFPSEGASKHKVSIFSCRAFAGLYLGGRETYKQLAMHIRPYFQNTAQQEKLTQTDSAQAACSLLRPV